ncbi:hypothetical protein M5K25_025164 [Dendrobium thyrsiflorum]|uniref:Carbonic anhydrase n=1 Tax=Dendrobium thyrsiflorum TaxID=117978 RepID=A0ABD0U8H4_DENTH
MAGPASKLAVISPFLIVVLLLSPLSNGQEVEDEKEFSYEVGSENGPDNWGQIHEDWAACGVGKLQSPIDLKDERVEVVYGLGHLRRTYRTAPAVMKNRGHDIMLKWEGDAGGLWINGTQYKLKQLHWHSSSEHTINEQKYDLELHMVHESADKKIAVVGILYQLGRPDRFLAKMASSIKKLTDLEEGAEEKLGLVNPWRVRWGSRKYYSSFLAFFLLECAGMASKLSDPGFLGGSPSSCSFLDVLANSSSGNDFPELRISSFRGLPSLWISDMEIQDLVVPFQFSLVGFFPSKRPSLDSIRRFFFNLNLNGEVSVTLLDSSHILIKLANDLDYCRVFCHRSYLVYNYYMKLTKWSPLVDIGVESPVIPIWVSFSLLRPHLFAPRILNGLASLFGKPLKIDSAVESGLSRPVPLEANLTDSVYILVAG